MSSTETGRKAEAAVAAHLRTMGHKVLAQNWRTRWCEIDIVSQKSDTVYFTEVKYRVSDRQGDGLDYITSRKLKQMAFAAEFWVATHGWRGDYCLLAAAVTGSDYGAVTLINL